MAGRTNKDKDVVDPELDAVLDEIPPDINEPQTPEGDEEDDSGIPLDERLPDLDNEDPNPDVPVEEDVVTPKPEAETQEEKDKRYKSQQTEAQIQAERSRALIGKVDEAENLPAPTEEELKSFVAQDGVSWDELTNFEQSQAKRNYISEKKLQLITEGVKNTQKIDEWAKTVDDFIDTTDGKPEFVELSSHESDFRKFALKEAHRGAPIDVLLGAFLHNLPPEKKSRGSLFERGGGGEKVVPKTGVTDAEQAAKLRVSNPREYRRLLKAGQIKIEA